MTVLNIKPLHHIDHAEIALNTLNKEHTRRTSKVTQPFGNYQDHPQLSGQQEALLGLVELLQKFCGRMSLSFICVKLGFNSNMYAQTAFTGVHEYAYPRL